LNILVAGTYPVACGKLLEGAVSIDSDGRLAVSGDPLPFGPGVSALLAAACKTSELIGGSPPHALLAGDIGRGDGSAEIYTQVAEAARRLSSDIVVFHYMKPVMSLMSIACEELLSNSPSTLLLADAGGMYAAKAAGLSRRFELMTPDVGEIGFLADPDISHPAYASPFHVGGQPLDPTYLARQAWETGGSSNTLIVKGQTDYIVHRGNTVRVIDDPSVPALEAIGGTGDTLSGIACALIAAGYSSPDAGYMACVLNRQAGLVMQATPAMRAADLVQALPDVVYQYGLPKPYGLQS